MINISTDTIIAASSSLVIASDSSTVTVQNKGSLPLFLTTTQNATGGLRLVSGDTFTFTSDSDVYVNNPSYSNATICIVKIS